MNLENRHDTIDEIEKKIKELEITLRIPNLPENFIEACISKIKMYRDEIDCIKFY